MVQSQLARVVPDSVPMVARTRIEASYALPAMKSRGGVLACLYLMLLAAGLAVPMQAGAVVSALQGLRIEGGLVQGVRVGRVEAFKGIPYAAAPLGALRWRPPQPVKSWRGARAADSFGPDCLQIQRGSLGDQDFAPGSAEDCLYLNVWRPAGDGERHRPVIVWIYGGAFITGGSSNPRQDGTRFAEQGIILVSFNYRLGRFGFFGFPALTREYPREPHGNYAYMDQLAALRWVARNIAAFDGDPANVTVMGESAGGESIATLLAMPAAAGLFHRAVMQSSGARTFLTGMTYLSEDRSGRPSAEQLGVNFAASVGITGNDRQALRKLRALPAARIAAGVRAQALTKGELDSTYSGPMIDGLVVAQEPRSVYAEGRTPKLDIMSGATNWDLGTAPASSKAELFDRFAAARSQAQAAYDPDGHENLETLSRMIGSDQMMVEPARFLAATAARRGAAAYEYRFAYVQQSLRPLRPHGATHGDDVPYTFAASGSSSAPFSTADMAVAQRFNAYIANFARNGNPDGEGLPHWPAYTAVTDTLLEFSADGTANATRDPWAMRLDLCAGRQPVTRP